MKTYQFIAIIFILSGIFFAAYASKENNLRDHTPLVFYLLGVLVAIFGEAFSLIDEKPSQLEKNEQA